MPHSVSAIPSAITTDPLAPTVTHVLDKIRPENRDAIRRFLVECRSQKCQQGTLRFYAMALEHLDRTLQKSFDTMTRDDAIAWVNDAQTKLAPMTVERFVRVAKRFFVWVGSPNVFAEVRFASNGDRRWDIDVLDKSEILRMAQAADHQRDRTMMMVLYDLGCRSQGLLGLRVRDIESGDFGIRIRVRESKNGSDRVIPATRSNADLKTWLSMLPGPRDQNGNLDPDTPLWMDLRRRGQSIGWNGLNHTLKRLAKRAGITKRVHAHGFRHTRATHLSKRLTDRQLQAFFGWKSSRMPAHYSHLTATDVEAAVREEAGVEPRRPKPDPLQVRPCGNCGHANPPTAMLCGVCNRSLVDALALATYGLQKDGDTVVAEVLRRLIERVPQVMAEVLNDPSIKDRLTDLDKRAALSRNSA